MSQTPALESNELKTLCNPACMAFSYMPDVAFFVKDLDGKFVMANQNFLRLIKPFSKFHAITKRP